MCPSDNYESSLSIDVTQYLSLWTVDRVQLLWMNRNPFVNCLNINHLTCMSYCCGLFKTKINTLIKDKERKSVDLYQWFQVNKCHFYFIFSLFLFVCALYVYIFRRYAKIASIRYALFLTRYTHTLATKEKMTTEANITLFYDYCYYMFCIIIIVVVLLYLSERTVSLMCARDCRQFLPLSISHTPSVRNTKFRSLDTVSVCSFVFPLDSLCSLSAHCEPVFITSKALLCAPSTASEAWLLLTSAVTMQTTKFTLCAMVPLCKIVHHFFSSKNHAHSMAFGSLCIHLISISPNTFRYRIHSRSHLFEWYLNPSIEMRSTT